MNMYVGYLISLLLTTCLSVAFSYCVNTLGGRITSLRDHQFISTDWFQFGQLYAFPVFTAAFSTVFLSLLISRTTKKPRALHALSHVYDSQRSQTTFGELLANFAANASCLMLGISLGRFGSCVLIGSMVGLFMGHKLSYNSEETLALSLCCSVAFVSTCIGTPLSALVFALESTRDFATRKVRLLLCFAFIGVAVGRYFNVAMQTSLLHGEASWRYFSNFFEFLIAVIIGLMGLVVSWVFEFCHTTAIKSRQYLHPKLNFNSLNFTPVAGAALLLIAYAVLPSTTGTSGVVVKQSLWGMMIPKRDLVSFILFKILSSSVSLAYGFHGGVVGPCLVLGCVVGNLALVSTVELGFDVQVDAHILAAAGAASVIAAVIKLPLFALIFSCEMFDAFHGCTFGLVGALVAFSLSSTPTDLLSSPTPLPEFSKQTPIPSSLFSYDFTQLSTATASVEEIIAALGRGGEVVLVDDAGTYVGCVDHTTLAQTNCSSVSDIPRLNVAVLDVGADAALAVRLLATQTVAYLAVCSGDRFVALLRSTALLVHLHGHGSGAPAADI